MTERRLRNAAKKMDVSVWIDDGEQYVELSAPGEAIFSAMGGQTITRAWDTGRSRSAAFQSAYDDMRGGLMIWEE